MSYAPKRMITIYKWRIPVKVIFYGILVVLLVVSIFLPWLSIGTKFIPLTATKSAEGGIYVTLYGWGWEGASANVIEVATGNAIPLQGVASGSSFVFGAMIFTVPLIIAVLIYVLLILLELDIVRLEISGKIQKILENLPSFLVGFSVISFPYVAPFLPSVLSGKTLGWDYIWMITLQRGVYDREPQTAVKIFMNWGSGYTLAFLVFLILIIYTIHTLLFSRFDFNWYWSLRAYMALLMSIAALFPVYTYVIGQFPTKNASTYVQGTLLFFYKYSPSGIQVGLVNINALVLFIIGIVSLLVVIIAAKLPVGNLMKREPFITLALPEDEIIRRHKILPKLVKELNLLDILLSLLAFVAIYYMYVFYVKVLGSMAVYIEIYASTGILMATWMAYIVTLAIVIQALLIFIPTSRG